MHLKTSNCGTTFTIYLFNKNNIQIVPSTSVKISILLSAVYKASEIKQKAFINPSKSKSTIKMYLSIL